MWLSGLFRKQKNKKIPENIPAENLPKTGGMLHVSFSTDAGMLRPENEDNFFVQGFGCKTEKICSGHIRVSDESMCIFAVFDGMGGEARGAEASAIAAGMMQDFAFRFAQSTEQDISSVVREYVRRANAEICTMTEETHCGRSGCTMALVCILHGTAYAYSIGDSRIYHLQCNQLQQILEDQTLAMRKLKANIYTEEEARNSSDAHKITSYIGVDTRNTGVSMHCYPPFTADGKILICSDGLTDMCSDDEIAALLGKVSENPAYLLSAQGLQNGGEDNVTCVVMQYET